MTPYFRHLGKTKEIGGYFLKGVDQVLTKGRRILC